MQILLFQKFIFKVTVVEKAIMCLLAVLGEWLFPSEPLRRDCQSPEWNRWCVKVRAQRGPLGPHVSRAPCINSTQCQSFLGVTGMGSSECCYQGWIYAALRGTVSMWLPHRQKSQDPSSPSPLCCCFKEPWENSKGVFQTLTCLCSQTT